MSGWIKTGSKGCVCRSLSVTPGILHPRALTRWGKPLSPGAIHLPVLCALVGSTQPDLAATVGVWARDPSCLWTHLLSLAAPHCGVPAER